MSNQGHASAVMAVMSVVASARQTLQGWEEWKNLRGEVSLLELAALWAALQRQKEGASSSEALEIETILRRNQERLAENVLEFKTGEWLEAGACLVAHQKRLETDDEYLWSDAAAKECREKYEPLCCSKLKELDNALLSLATARTFCGNLPTFNAVEDELEKCTRFVEVNPEAFYNGFIWAQETTRNFGVLSPELSQASRVVVAVAAYGEKLMKESRGIPAQRIADEK